MMRSTLLTLSLVVQGKKDQLTLADMQDSLNQVSDDAAGALSTIF